jgi:tetratricopeptide (TPR) repeat protein
MSQPATPEIESRISERTALARQAWERGNKQEAENLFLQAWGLLPEPPTEYDRAQSLSRALVTFFRDTGQFEKAKKWLNTMRLAYGPEPNESVEFMAGTVYFDGGESDEAFRIFDALFKKFKRRPFQGKDKKYLEFYNSRASASK